MTSTFLSATALTFVISDTQKDVHVFVPETLDVCVVRTIAMTLSSRVHQAVHVYHDHKALQWRLCPVPRTSIPPVDAYGVFCHCFDATPYPSSEKGIEGHEEAQSSAQNQPLGYRPDTGRAPRPSNSWILYRQAKSKAINKDKPGYTATQISTMIAEMWREESAEVKAQWQQLAKEEEQQHAAMYPGYKYTTRKPKKAS